MSYIVYTGQLAYFLTFASFAFRNVTWLRSVAIVSSSVAIYYSAAVTVEPLWVPIVWNVLFIITNVIQLLLTRWRARAVTLDPLEEFLGKTVLQCFPPAEVKSFSAIGREGEIPNGTHLIEAGTELNHLFCIVKGKVDIVANGNKVAELTSGFFVGEMSLLTKQKTRADVIAATELRILAWPHDQIEKWVDADATRLSLLQQALGMQVVDQLLRQNDALLKEVRGKEAN